MHSDEIGGPPWWKFRWFWEPWLPHVTAIEWLLISGGIGGSITIRLFNPRASEWIAFLLGNTVAAAIETIREIPGRRKEKAKDTQHDEERAEDKRRLDKILAENQELVKAERRRTLLLRQDTNAAYYLGHLATALPMHAASVPYQLPRIQMLCRDLLLRFSEEEERILESPPGPQFDTEKVAEMILAKGRDLPPRLRCFFSFGNTAAWLRAEVDTACSTARALDQLKTIRGNPNLELDPDYQKVVDDLIGVLLPYREAVPDETRELLKRRTLDALGKIPAIHIDPGPQNEPPVWMTRWIPVTEDGALVPIAFIGNKDGVLARILAYDENTYDVAWKEDMESKTRVTRDDTGWHCATHTTANEKQVCREIELALKATDGGKPVKDLIIMGHDREGSDGGGIENVVGDQGV
ncbi:MAG: hypothetical protein ACLP7O_01895 [Terracidiphilus sp.]